VSILPAIFWRQQISWSYCLVSAVEDSVSWHEKGYFVRRMAAAKGMVERK